MKKEMTQDIRIEKCTDTRSEENWNFYREYDNHAYIKGNSPKYEGSCKNNLIVSEYPINTIKDVSNSFILGKEGKITLFPLENVKEVVEKAKETIYRKSVKYNIPKYLVLRENLKEKSIKFLSNLVEEKFGIQPKNLELKSFSRTKNGIYFFNDSEGKKYVLKQRGRDREKAELISLITNKFGSFFPHNYLTNDSSKFTVRVGDEIFGLEDFVVNENPKVRDSDYFSLIGEKIGLLHNELSKVDFENARQNEVIWKSRGNEEKSSLASFYLDLVLGNQDNSKLIAILENLLENGLEKKGRNLTTDLILGDINHSNVVWQGNNPVIIDSETLGKTRRVNEFVSPLLYGEQMKKPEYIEGSLESIIYSYNKTSNKPLRDNEIEFLPYLLKYSFLKNHVVNFIRRGREEFKGNAEINLEKVEE